MGIALFINYLLTIVGFDLAMTYLAFRLYLTTKAF